MPRREIRTQIGIEAAPEEVWRVLADFGAFPEWNPLIREISGEAKPGARLRVTIQPPGASPMAFQPIVIVCDPPRELRWLGRVLIPGLLTENTASPSRRWARAGALRACRDLQRPLGSLL